MSVAVPLARYRAERKVVDRFHNSLIRSLNYYTLDCDLLQDIENRFLSTARQVGNSVLRKQQFQQLSRVGKSSVIVDCGSEIQTTQSVAQPVESSHLKCHQHNTKLSARPSL